MSVGMGLGMDTGWKRLGARIKLERSRQWPRRRDFAAATGISVRLLSDVENGKRANFAPETLAVIESALGWESGDAERVRNGLEPNRQYCPQLVRLIELWSQLPDQTRRALVNFAEDHVHPR